MNTWAKLCDEYSKQITHLIQEVKDKNKELSELRNSVEELESEKEQYKLWFHRQKDKTVELYQQNQSYKQALEFYADIRNYHSELWENTAIEDDCGRIARQILADNHD